MEIAKEFSIKPLFRKKPEITKCVGKYYDFQRENRHFVNSKKENNVRYGNENYFASRCFFSPFKAS